MEKKQNTSNYNSVHELTSAPHYIALKRNSHKRKLDLPLLEQNEIDIKVVSDDRYAMRGTQSNPPDL